MNTVNSSDSKSNYVRILNGNFQIYFWGLQVLAMQIWDCNSILAIKINAIPTNSGFFKAIKIKTNTFYLKAIKISMNLFKCH